MKFQKMDSKQVPQVVVLCVLVAGVLGYAGYTYFGATPAPAATTSSDKRMADASSTSAPEEGANPDGQAANMLPPGTLGGTFNSDPFKPAVESRPAETDPQAKVGVRTPKPQGKTANPQPAAAATAGAQGATKTATAQASPSTANTAQATPEPPTRPDLVVTGIIDAEDGDDMALVNAGTNRHVLRVGDVLVTNERTFKVKTIGMNGISIVEPVKLKKGEKLAKGAKLPKPGVWNFPVGKPDPKEVAAKADTARPDGSRAKEAQATAAEEGPAVSVVGKPGIPPYAAKLPVNIR